MRLLARTFAHTRARGIGAKGGRKVTAPWEYLDLREMEGAGRGTGRRAQPIRGSWLVGASRSGHNWLTSRATTHSNKIQNDRPPRHSQSRTIRKGPASLICNLYFQFTLAGRFQEVRSSGARPIFSRREKSRRGEVSRFLLSWKSGGLMVTRSERRFFFNFAPFPPGH